MTTAIYLIVALVALIAFYLVLSRYLKFRGTRVVTCPETSKPAAVEVDVTHAALTDVLGKPSFRLTDCSRWPERQSCGQECLGQIELAPEGCLVRTILTKWYEEKSCVLCGKPLGEIDWLEHKPALMSTEQKTVEWHEVRAEKVPEALSTHMPVCWNCHIAETFRREFPDLVVDRPWKGEETRRQP